MTTHSPLAGELLFVALLVCLLVMGVGFWQWNFKDALVAGLLGPYSVPIALFAYFVCFSAGLGADPCFWWD